MSEPPSNNDPLSVGRSWMSSSVVVRDCINAVADDAAAFGWKLELSAEGLRLSGDDVVGPTEVSAEDFLHNPRRVTQSLRITIRDRQGDQREGRNQSGTRDPIGRWLAVGGELGPSSGPASPYSGDWIGERSG